MDQQKHTTEDTLTDIFGSKEMRSPAPTEFIPKNKTAPEIAYQLVKDETYPQTQPRLNLATFVTTYMDDYATRLMNEAININYIDETEYPRIAVMNGKCINIVANLWNSPEKDTWKTEHFRNQHLPRVKMAGLNPQGNYRIRELNRIDNQPLIFEGQIFSGAYLMANGLEIPYDHLVDRNKKSDYSSRILYLLEVSVSDVNK